MKFNICLLALILSPVFLFSQNAEIFNQYKIPSYSFGSLKIFGQDFLSYSKTDKSISGNSTENFTIHGGLSGYFFIQKPEETHNISGRLNYLYESNTETRYETKTKYETSILNLHLQTTNNWYLTGEKGLFLYFNPAFVTSQNLKEKLKSNLAELSFGIGYGRINHVKSLVQSYIILDETETQITDELILKLAEIIEKEDAGYYEHIYKDSSDIVFYDEIARLTQQPERTTKIDQILRSYLYKTTSREIGWNIMAGINPVFSDAHRIYGTNSYDGIFKFSESYDLSLSANYGLPIGFDKQFNASVNFSQNLEDDIYRAPRLLLSSSFSVDHNYNWSTSLSGSFQTAYPEAGDAISNLNIVLTSQLAVINMFTVYAYIKYENIEFANLEGLTSSPIVLPISPYKTYQFNIGFSYYLL